MSGVDDIIDEAKQDGKFKCILDYVVLRGSRLTPDERRKIGDLKINAGRRSSCDDDGYTDDNHLLADCAEAQYRHSDSRMSHDQACDEALKDVPIDNGSRDPKETLEDVLAGDRPRVRSLMIKRGTWRQPKRGQKAK